MNERNTIMLGISDQKEFVTLDNLSLMSDLKKNICSQFLTEPFDNHCKFRPK